MEERSERETKIYRILWFTRQNRRKAILKKEGPLNEFILMKIDFFKDIISGILRSLERIENPIFVSLTLSSYFTLERLAELHTDITIRD